MDFGQYIADHSDQILDWVLAAFGAHLLYHAWIIGIWQHRPAVCRDPRTGQYTSARSVVADRSYRNRHPSAILDTTNPERDTEKGTVQ